MVASPRRNTLMVCVNVTILPKITACFAVPLSPTRYAATIVFPWPGSSACSAPNQKASPSRVTMSGQEISFRRSIREIASSRFTVPAEAASGGRESRPPEGIPAGGAIAPASATALSCVASATTNGLPATGIEPAALVHSNHAAESCGGAFVGSCGYEVSAWLTSKSPRDAFVTPAPDAGLITISRHPARVG